MMFSLLKLRRSTRSLPGQTARIKKVVSLFSLLSSLLFHLSSLFSSLIGMARDAIKAKTRKQGHGASERMKRGRKRKRRKVPPPLSRAQGEGGPPTREEKEGTEEFGEGRRERESE